MERKSFILYGSYAKQFEKLDDESAGQLIKAIFAYVNDEELPEIKDTSADMAFSFICAQIDRDQEVYKQKCEVNRKNAKLGGRPKKQTVSEKPNGFLKNRSVLEEEPPEQQPREEKAEPDPAPTLKVKKQKHEYPKDFDEFWETYPRHDQKGYCYQKYQARRKDGYSPEELLTAARNYREWTEKTHKEKQYIKCGRTFLSDALPFLDYLNVNSDLQEMAEQKPAGNKNTFNSFTQRDRDYTNLERKIFGVNE